MSKAATAVIEKGTIIIRLPIKNLKMAVEGYVDSDFGIEPMIVTNVQAFAKSVVRALNEEEENGSTPIHHMFDAAFEQALENGSEGVEEANRCEQCDRVVPTDETSFDEESGLTLCRKCL